MSYPSLCTVRSVCLLPAAALPNTLLPHGILLPCNSRLPLRATHYSKENSCTAVSHPADSCLFYSRKHSFVKVSEPSHATVCTQQSVHSLLYTTVCTQPENSVANVLPPLHHRTRLILGKHRKVCHCLDLIIGVKPDSLL